MRINLYKLVLAVATVIATGCSGRPGSGMDSMDSAAYNDSIAQAELLREPEAYPDTMYASANNVKFDVQDFGTGVSGKLMSLRDLYAGTKGIYTFRGGPKRDADFGGRVDSLPSQLMVEWEFQTDRDDTVTQFGAWGGGTGWTGQPLYVEWPDSALDRFKAAGFNAAKEEVMIGSLCGKVYFLDYATGKNTRQPIATGNPIKGTMSLDPTLNGNLYVGQGVPSSRPISALTLNVFANEITSEFGPDGKAYRHWHAYDSSAIRVGDFVFRPGENGTLYKWLPIGNCGEMKLHTALRYRVNGAAPGMEASMAVSRNYGFTADNAGNVICFNLETMKPVWHYKLPDDVDASPVLSEEDGRLYLYAGCEVEHSGVTKARFVKLDALTGQEIWVNETEAQRADVGTKHFDGGYYSTPLLGQGNCKDLIFVNVVHNTHGQNGSFIAINKKDGKLRYSSPLGYYAWSSPVGFMTPQGQQVVVTFDCSGRGYIFNGKDGKELGRENIGANFESSPIVRDNYLVIGSRGSKIYKLSLK